MQEWMMMRIAQQCEVPGATELQLNRIKIVLYSVTFTTIRKKKRLGPNLDIPDPLFQVLQVSSSSIKTPLITVILSC